MSIRKKPQEAVPVLLACLQKVEKQVMEATDRQADSYNTLSSEFQEIKTALESVNLLPEIKKWEEKVTEELCLLVCELDDIFKVPQMESQIQKLKSIRSKIDKLSTLNSEVKTMSVPSSDKQPVEGFDKPMVSKKWLDLKMEDRIFKSMAMSSLFASFHCLEKSQVKMCLLYLSIFPEKSVIKKKPLIYWWIGEGLATRNGNRTAEEDGEELFQELLKEGFVRASSEKQKSFMVDPWIRRLLIRLAKERQFLSFSNDWKPCNDRHRAFLWQENEQISNGDDEREEKKVGDDVREKKLSPQLTVLNVLNVNKQYLEMGREWLEKLKKLEVLQMGRWQDSNKHHIEVENQMLDGLGTQKHLKYLSLRGISRIEKLPPSISKLISLQILDLRACHNLESLPPGISALKNLTHLDVSECYLLETMPRGLEHLLNLQVLKGFVVGIAGKNSCKIRDLSRLKKLRKLTIRVGNLKEAHSDDQLQSLATFQALSILTISWGAVPSESEPSLNVKLPTSLTKLDLRNVPFRDVPQWMWPKQLPNLEKLYIIGGKLDSLKHQDSESLKLILVQTSCHKRDPDIELNRELHDLGKAAT